MGYKSNRHVLRSASCQYHVVFCPKYRRKVLVNGVDKRLKEIIDQVAKELGCEVMELEGMPDHVPILCKAGERSEFSFASPRVSTLEKQVTYFVDTFLFCVYCGWCAHCHFEAVHRKPKECLNAQHCYACENLQVSPATLQEPANETSSDVGTLSLGLQRNTCHSQEGLGAREEIRFAL